MRAVDLEFDYLITQAQALVDPSNATVNYSGRVATVTPNPASPIGPVSVGIGVVQLSATSVRPIETGYDDETAVNVGLGSGKLTGMPGVFYSAPNAALESSTGGTADTFGSFAGSALATGSNYYSATINWGDGSTLSGTNVVSVTPSPYLPTTYNIAGPSHTYTNPGIYPLNVTVTNTNGSILQLNNTAVVSAGPIYAFGRSFTAARGKFNGLVATFVDNSSNTTIPADYQATILWGDGSKSVVTGGGVATGAGAIRGSHGSFQLYSNHNYTAGTTYPVDVTINSTTSSSSAYAWSTATLTSVPTHQPPIAQSHIVAQLGNPGFGNGFLDEEVTLFNSGNKASGPVNLKFYLSPTPTMTGGAIPLQVGKNSFYQAISIPPGEAIAGAVSDILLPAGVIFVNKYIIMQVITTDPVANHMPEERIFADPNPLVE